MHPFGGVFPALGELVGEAVVDGDEEGDTLGLFEGEDVVGEPDGALVTEEAEGE